MKGIELHLPQDFDKSFIVFREAGRHFPCPWHYHAEYELTLVLSSTGKRMVGNHIGYFKKNDLVFMGKDLPHVWANDEKYLQGKSAIQADAIVIQFGDNFLGEQFFNIPEMSRFKHFLGLSSRGIEIKGAAKRQIIEIMKSMVNMNGLKRLSSILLIFDILSNTKDYELLASPNYSINKRNKPNSQVSIISDYIKQKYRSEISLNEMAKLVHMGTTTFCNFFKENFRQTFTEYLNSIRIGQACELLSENEYNIVEISYECGYRSIVNFNRQFKKITKMTPKEFRKTLKL